MKKAVLVSLDKRRAVVELLENCPENLGVIILLDLPAKVTRTFVYQPGPGMKKSSVPIFVEVDSVYLCPEQKWTTPIL